MLALALAFDAVAVVDTEPTPANILGSSLYSWWDAQNNASLTVAGGVVAQAADLGPNNIPILNDQSTQRPTLTNTINGRQALHFVAANSKSLWTNPG
ncbi:MAG: hypothetical protein KGL39_41145, partial [Patescibacteria group bacterium]|nr:hypothetical protein [Patescibacteria group bacterium]